MTQNAQNSQNAQKAKFDEEQICAAARGDMVAFRQLYDAHVDYVTRNVARIIGPAPELEDIVQDVFISVHRSLPAYRGDCAFTTWLFRITRNVTIDYLRRRKPTTVELDTWRMLKASSSEWERLEARDLLRSLYAALENVNPEQREAFLLHEVEGMKLREVAELTQESINTVAARVRRTRERLKTLLMKEHGGDHV